MAGRITGRTKARSAQAVNVGQTRTGRAGNKRTAGYGGRISSGTRGGLADAALGASGRALGRSSPGTGLGGGSSAKAGGDVSATTTQPGGSVISTPVTQGGGLRPTGPDPMFQPTPSITPVTRPSQPIGTASTGVRAPSLAAPTGAGSNVSANVGTSAPILPAGSRFPGASKPAGTKPAAPVSSVRTTKPKRPGTKPTTRPTNTTKAKRPSQKAPYKSPSSARTTKPKRPAAKPAATTSTYRRPIAL